VLASESPWGVSDLALTLDGQIAATVSNDDGVRVWRVNDGQLLSEGYSMYGQSVAFSPIESLLALKDHEVGIELWPVPPLTATAEIAWKSGSATWHYPTYVLTAPEEERLFPAKLVFSPDGLQLVAALETGHILIWQVSDGTLLRTLISQDFSLRDIAFSPDGKVLASVSYRGLLELWDPLTGALLYTVDLSPKVLDTVAFSPDGRFLATGSSDGTVRLWGIP
jgi:WD40 repeat protein